MQDMETNYIRQGDCLELMKEIPDGSVDMVLCDLPYGTTSCKWDNIIPFEPLWEQYKRIIKPNGAICLFGSEPFSTYIRMSNIKDFKNDWIWVKSQGANFTQVKREPLKNYEIISVFGKPNYNPQGVSSVIINKSGNKKNGGIFTSISKNKDYTQTQSNYPNAVLYFSSKSEKRYHPTQKPVALLQYLIRTYTNEGDLVLDNCMGSGSTCVAAIREKRHYIGFELQPEYFEIARNRIEDEKRQLTLF